MRRWAWTAVWAIVSGVTVAFDNFWATIAVGALTLLVAGTSALVCYAKRTPKVL